MLTGTMQDTKETRLLDFWSSLLSCVLNAKSGSRGGLVAEFEHQSVDASHTVPKFGRWVLVEGLSQSCKNFGVIIFAAFLHFSINALLNLLPIDGQYLQQLYNGSKARYIVLEMMFLVVGYFAVAPVLMATHVSLIKGISNWAAITSKPLKEWDRFVGMIVFWAIGASLIFTVPKFWSSFLTNAFSISVFIIFSTFIATWMPAIIYGEKDSFRRVVARGKKTFWYVFSRVIIFVLFALLVSAAALLILMPIIRFVLPTVQDPDTAILMVNNAGTAVITSCLAPILSVICVRAYILGEARLTGSSDWERAETDITTEVD